MKYEFYEKVQDGLSRGFRMSHPGTLGVPKEMPYDTEELASLLKMAAEVVQKDHSLETTEHVMYVIDGACEYLQDATAVMITIELQIENAGGSITGIESDFIETHPGMVKEDAVFNTYRIAARDFVKVKRSFADQDCVGHVPPLFLKHISNELSKMAETITKCEAWRAELIEAWIRMKYTG